MKECRNLTVTFYRAAQRRIARCLLSSCVRRVRVVKTELGVNGDPEGPIPEHQRAESGMGLLGWGSQPSPHELGVSECVDLYSA